MTLCSYEELWRVNITVVNMIPNMKEKRGHHKKIIIPLPMRPLRAQFYLWQEIRTQDMIEYG